MMFLELFVPRDALSAEQLRELAGQLTMRQLLRHADTLRDVVDAGQAASANPGVMDFLDSVNHVVVHEIGTWIVDGQPQDRAGPPRYLARIYVPEDVYKRSIPGTSDALPWRPCGPGFPRSHLATGKPPNISQAQRLIRPGTCSARRSMRAGDTRCDGIRRLSEHSQHRLFLSATPHNGYSWSWQALLEMLDPQRFVKGREPYKQTLDPVMVRRLKTDIKNPDGTDRFPARTIRAVDINYTAAEREAYDLLQQYTAARRAKASAAAARAGDLVTLILKKRLFSSPAAFALTLESHLQSEDQDHHPERTAGTPSALEDFDWMDDVLDWDTEPADDEPGSDEERAAFGRIAALLGIADDVALTGGSVMEAAFRRQLAEWAERHGEPADSKAVALVEELNAICRPGGDWGNGERVIVFTEYKATQQWLAGILTARGLGGERLGLLYGGMDENRRERLKAAFQAATFCATRDRYSRSPA